MTEKKEAPKTINKISQLLTIINNKEELKMLELPEIKYENKEKINNEINKLVIFNNKFKEIEKEYKNILLTVENQRIGIQKAINEKIKEIETSFLEFYQKPIIVKKTVGNLTIDLLELPSTKFEKIKLSNKKEVFYDEIKLMWKKEFVKIGKKTLDKMAVKKYFKKNGKLDGFTIKNTSIVKLNLSENNEIKK